MTGFNHTLFGSIVAVLVPAPFVPLVALVSHFVLDAMPHFGRHPKIAVDEQGRYSREFKLMLVGDALLCLISLLFAWWLFPDKWLIIAIGVCFSIGPDFLWLFEPRALSRPAKAFFRFAIGIQWGERPWGWILEIAYGVLFASILIWLAG